MLVIYSDRTGRIRRIIQDEVLTDDMLEVLFPVGAGEALAKGLTGNSLEELQAALSARTRKVPTGSGRCVVVNDQGEVIGALMADRGIDSVEGGILVPHDDARFGWRQLRDRSFQRSLAEIDSDIALSAATSARLNSTEFRDQEAADPEGLTEAEIDALIAAMDSERVVLRTERTARAGPRP